MAWIPYSPYRVRVAIRTRGLTASDIARRSRGVLSPATIRNLEKSVYQQVESARLTALAKALYIPVEELQE
jgi:transcriptional regulator with XRE-family HTH domain